MNNRFSESDVLRTAVQDAEFSTKEVFRILPGLVDKGMEQDDAALAGWLLAAEPVLCDNFLMERGAYEALLNALPYSDDRAAKVFADLGLDITYARLAVEVREERDRDHASKGTGQSRDVELALRWLQRRPGAAGFWSIFHALRQGADSLTLS